jgi:hypothetical protein
VDATSVYWTHYAVDANGNFTSDILRVGLDGSAVSTVVSGQQGGIPGVAVDAANLYWLVDHGSDDDGAVMKVALGGGTPATLALVQGDPTSIAVDATHVYWAAASFSPSQPLGGVTKVPIEGGTVTTLMSGQRAIAVAVDATSVYWATSMALAGVGGYAGSVQKLTPK